MSNIMPIPRAVGAPQNTSLPTVLVAEFDNELRISMASGLRKRGYIVLESKDDGEALGWVKLHSRHIHVLLISGNRSGRLLATTMKPYRPDMEIIFIAEHEQDRSSDTLAPDLVLERVMGIVKPRLAASASGGY